MDFTKLDDALQKVANLPGHYFHPFVGTALNELTSICRALSMEVQALQAAQLNKENASGTTSASPEALAESTSALHRLSQAGEEGQGAGNSETVKLETEAPGV